MPIQFLGLIVLIVFIALIVILKTIKKGDYNPYTLAKSILTPAEASFASVLEQAIPQGHLLCYKVRLADIIEVDKSLDSKSRLYAFNRISAKHIDFLIVRAGNKAPVLAIELDEKSHEAPKRKKRDAFLEETLAQVGLKIYRPYTAHNYTLTDIKRQISEFLSFT